MCCAWGRSRLENPRRGEPTFGTLELRLDPCLGDFRTCLIDVLQLVGIQGQTWEAAITCTLYRWTSITVTDTIGSPGPCPPARLVRSRRGLEGKGDCSVRQTSFLIEYRSRELSKLHPRSFLPTRPFQSMRNHVSLKHPHRLTGCDSGSLPRGDATTHKKREAGKRLEHCFTGHMPEKFDTDNNFPMMGSVLYARLLA